MFPFDYPAATASYVLWYLLTLVLHVLPMNYVLAGSTYLAILAAWEVAFGAGDRQRPLAALVRSWIPLALGVAITAGVAPLLFLQILYRREFYTANLLLFNRWMAILPVLIVAFYLLYLQKSQRWLSWPAVARAVISLGILGCFGFVAWSWTENHLLSLQDESVWTTQYASPDWFYHNPEHFPRLAVWYLGAFPTMATMLAAQFLLTNGSLSVDDGRPARTLACLALSGLIAAALAVLNYALVLPEPVIARMTKPDGLSMAGVAVFGYLAQVAVWVRIYLKKSLTYAAWWIAAGGVVIATSAATYLRELRRVVALDLSQGLEEHTKAAQVGGEATFLFFLAVNAAVIVALIVLIRRGIRPADAAER